MTSTHPLLYSLCMDTNNNPNSDHGYQDNVFQDSVYEIRVQGHLDSLWLNWFSGFCIQGSPEGETVLTGPVPDQSALFGVLKKVRDLGLPLLAVNRVDRSCTFHDDFS